MFPVPPDAGKTIQRRENQVTEEAESRWLGFFEG
jgi:hypothetical protein